MSKSEIKVRAQDHFKSKINRLVKPQIQREELKLKADSLSMKNVIYATGIGIIDKSRQNMVGFILENLN